MLRVLRVLPVGLALWATLAVAQGNGKLQIHFMDVGQGDGALLISPGGQTVLFDDGALGSCDKPVSYLQQLGITKVDYHIASHYHSDHIGCAVEVLQECPLQHEAYDRGQSYSSTAYDRYVQAVGNHRKTATETTKIELDQNSAHPVEVDIVALNGNGIQTTNENDLSVVAVIHCGAFAAEVGGDLSGYQTNSYLDIESSVAPKVGHIQVYKVHHHGSAYSSNDTWLSTTTPIVGIVSTGDGNRYSHPTAECLERLHHAGVKTYWTEQGNGVAPEPGFDVVGGNIVVETSPGSSTFTVRHNATQVDTYSFTGGAAPPPPPPAATQFAWSKLSKVYHYATCSYVANISPANLARGDAAPAGKHLHAGCPK